LNDQNCFQYSEKFQNNSVFQSKCSKILNDKKYVFNTVNSGHTPFFRTSAKFLKNAEW